MASRGDNGDKRKYDDESGEERGTNKRIHGTSTFSELKPSSSTFSETKQNEQDTGESSQRSHKDTEITAKLIQYLFLQHMIDVDKTSFKTNLDKTKEKTWSRKHWNINIENYQKNLIKCGLCAKFFSVVLKASNYKAHINSGHKKEAQSLSNNKKWLTEHFLFRANVMWCTICKKSFSLHITDNLTQHLEKEHNLRKDNELIQTDDPNIDRLLSRFINNLIDKHEDKSEERAVFKFQDTKWNVNRTVNLAAYIEPELAAIVQAGTWKNERIIASPQGTKITLSNGTKALNFCANNYLGLADNKDVIDAAKIALDKYGAGLSSVRFICGTQEIHVELEKKIARFHGREDAILYASCLDANAGVFETLLNADDAVLSDELNHASIIDGIRLCKAKRYKYKHRDMIDLESKLQECKSARLRLIATDGVFSMDGTVAPLPKIIELAKKYDAITFVDDCHATGFFGKTGRGTEDYFGHLGSIDIINSTLGKALGGAAGGYTTSKKEVVSLLRQRSRPYLFSNSMPPSVVASASKVMDLIMDSTRFLDRLASNTEHFRNAMIKAGFIISGDNHPICPVMLGDAKLATTFADKMMEKGIYVIGFSYPVVPKDKARIRVQISAAHSIEEIDRAVKAFIQIGKEFAVIQ